MKILILSSLSFSLVNFRGALIRRMLAQGHKVVTAAPDAEPAVLATLEEWGAEFRITPMARAGTSLLADMRTLWHYSRLVHAERPDVVVAYTQKPIIYGGIAARLGGNIPFFAIMSGLGYVFSDASDHRPFLRRLVARLYRFGVRRARCLFVFNGDDRRMMEQYGIVSRGQRVLQVPGSGVDTAHYAQHPLPDGPITFLMMGRLMRDKGVAEYAAAARQIRAFAPDTRFLLLGRPETENPTGIPESELAEWQESGLITLLPESRDVRPILGSAHVFVLPSYYREGLPRTILEALSTGRPVITTDMPGCREPIRPGRNGLLVPPRDAAALAKAMRTFIDQPDRIAAMAEQARQTAVEEYDVHLVNAMLMREMNLYPTDGTRTEESPRGDRAGLPAVVTS
jgi:Glycosyltransferase